MKKLVCLLTACLLLTSVSAAPAMNDYRYDDAGLTLSLPQGDEWVILTHDVQEGDPAIDFFDSDLETLQTSMDQNNIRFEAITQDRMCEITIVIMRDRTTRRTFNYALVEENELQSQAQAYVDKDYSRESPGLDYTSYELVPSGDILYLNFTGEITNETADSRFVQYATIYNGWMVNISLLSFDGQMSAENEQLAADIAASVRFDQALEKSQDAQQYIDMAIGIGIAVLAALFLLRFYRKKQRQMRLPSVTGTQPQDSDSSSADSADDQPPQQ